MKKITCVAVYSVYWRKSWWAKTESGTRQVVHGLSIIWNGRRRTFYALLFNIM